MQLVHYKHVLVIVLELKPPVIHAMSEVFSTEGTDGVLLIDATNAFNSMNRAVAMHNIRITCPQISLYIINTYRYPTHLFIAGGAELSSTEGTTQGDPLAMPWYAINTAIIIETLNVLVPRTKQVWLADDSSAGGKINNLYDWCVELEKIGKSYGYFVG